MSELFNAAPVVPALAEVVELHPSGVFVREDGGVYWVERRRGTRSTACVSYDVNELEQLRVAIDRALGPR